jgi:cytochrome c oxidase cbb3-type subunit 3
MAKVTDELLDHDYDGIKEYDNPLPGWWLYGFYACIAWAVAYVPYYHFMGGTLPEEAYAQDMEEWYKLHPPVQLAGAEEMKSIIADQAKVERGKEVFQIRCASCHAADGGGLVGPNLTDEFAIHGGAPHQLVKVVYDGVPAKGMLAWKHQLSLDDIYAVTAFAYSLQGTTPAKPKAPEGDPIGEGVAAQGAGE